jgi:hypothetical protein
VRHRTVVEHRAHSFGPWLFGLVLAVVLTIFLANLAGSIAAGTFPPDGEPPATAVAP